MMPPLNITLRRIDDGMSETAVTVKGVTIK